jgi:hypothetical protein
MDLIKICYDRVPEEGDIMKLFGMVAAVLGLAAMPALAQNNYLGWPQPLEGTVLHEQDVARADAYMTITDPIAPTLAEKRVAAVTYIDDALALLDMAHDHLQDAGADALQRRLAVSELMAASGKLTTAQLLLFKDRAAARRLAPIARRVELAERLVHTAPHQAANLIARDRNAIAGLYRAQLATMGGGAGMAPLEDLSR